jgi:hypothetical protein
MEAMLPIKQSGKRVNILPERGIIDILIKTELNASPLRYILISLNGNDVEHLVSEGGYSKICIGTENLGKGPFRL